MNDQIPTQNDPNMDQQSTPPIGATPPPLYNLSPSQPPQPPVVRSSSQTETWRTVVTILALIFMPLIGVVLTWVITNWSKGAKIAVTIIFAVFQVIAIMGILAAMVLLGMGQARGKARDTVAKSNVRQVTSALELYYDNKTISTTGGVQSGNYPITNSYKTMTDELISSKTIPSLPKDPEGYKYRYLYCSSDGNAFRLQVILKDINQPFEMDSMDSEVKDTCTPGE